LGGGAVVEAAHNEPAGATRIKYPPVVCFCCLDKTSITRLYRISKRYLDPAAIPSSGGEKNEIVH
jgi:hypothetical protein